MTETRGPGSTNTTPPGERLCWPFTPTPGLDPLYVERTGGAWLYTREGKQILDAAGGAVVVNIGHGRKEVAEVIAAAATANTYVLPVFLTPEREALLAELRQHWLPSHLTRALRGPQLPPFL